MGVAAKRLTVAEFLAMELPDEELMRYELHDGEIVSMTGPKPTRSNRQSLLDGLLWQYHLGQPEYRPVVEPNLQLSDEKLCRPDSICLLDPAKGGRCIERELSYEGPPVVVVEMLSSKPWVDLVTKRAIYAASGIPEYWVFSADETEALFLRLSTDRSVEAAVLKSGFYQTPLLQGFTLDVAAFFRRDFGALAAALQQPPQ